MLTHNSDVQKLFGPLRGLRCCICKPSVKASNIALQTGIQSAYMLQHISMTPSGLCKEVVPLSNLSCIELFFNLSGLRGKEASGSLDSMLVGVCALL